MKHFYCICVVQGPVSEIVSDTLVVEIMPKYI